MLTVSDVRAAVAWYAEVFGFVEHVKNDHVVAAMPQAAQATLAP